MRRTLSKISQGDVCFWCVHLLFYYCFGLSVITYCD